MKYKCKLVVSNRKGNAANGTVWALEQKKALLSS